MALLLRADAGSIAGFDPSDFAIVVAGVALLIFIGSSLAGSYRGRAGQAVRDLLTWALVALVLVGGYSYRDELLSLGHRVVGELLPPGTRSARRAAGRGRAVGAASAGGPTAISWSRPRPTASSLSMLVDTGASTVVLKPADAQRLGIDVDRLRYAVPVQTANGTTYAAQRAPAQPDASAPSA